MEPKIKKNGSKLTILSFNCPKGTVPEMTIDLISYTGEYIRIWLDEDMSYSLDKHKNHYWQIAELQVPAQEYQSVDTGDVDEQGLPVTIAELIPIEIGEIRLFDIEKEEK